VRRPASLRITHTKECVPRRFGSESESLLALKMKKAKNMTKIKKYEPKRVFLETLNGYIEAAKCRTLDNFTEVNTQ